MAEDAGRDPAGGRTLVFVVDACFFDGVARAETAGYFDEDDLPPWDTWLRFSADQGVLTSWVPAPLVVLVDRAVSAHGFDAYRWR